MKDSPRSLLLQSQRFFLSTQLKSFSVMILYTCGLLDKIRLISQRRKPVSEMFWNIFVTKKDQRQQPPRGDHTDMKTAHRAEERRGHGGDAQLLLLLTMVEVIFSSLFHCYILVCDVIVMCSVMLIVHLILPSSKK